MLTRTGRWRPAGAPHGGRGRGAPAGPGGPAVGACGAGACGRGACRGGAHGGRAGGRAGGRGACGGAGGRACGGGAGGWGADRRRAGGRRVRCCFAAPPRCRRSRFSARRGGRPGGAPRPDRGGVWHGGSRGRSGRGGGDRRPRKGRSVVWTTDGPEVRPLVRGSDRSRPQVAQYGRWALVPVRCAGGRPGGSSPGGKAGLEPRSPHRPGRGQSQRAPGDQTGARQPGTSGEADPAGVRQMPGHQCDRPQGGQVAGGEQQQGAKHTESGHDRAGLAPPTRHPAGMPEWWGRNRSPGRDQQPQAGGGHPHPTDQEPRPPGHRGTATVIGGWRSRSTSIRSQPDRSTTTRKLVAPPRWLATR